MQQQLGRSSSGPWTNHLREAARRASTPQPTLSASSLQEEYDPEAPALARVSSTHDEYDPEQPALERHGADEYDPAGTGQPTEEYDPAAPALARQGSGPEEEYDPAAPAAVAYEPLASRSDSFGAGASTPPGPGEQSPRSPAGSDEDEDTDRGRGKQSERGQHRSGSDAPAGRGPAAAGPGAARRGVVAADVALRHTAAALEAICRTVRLSEESWYKWGEAGEARLSGAKPLARGLLDQDLLGQLLRDPNVESELRWLLEQAAIEDRAEEQQPAETPSTGGLRAAAALAPPPGVASSGGGGSESVAGGAGRAGETGQRRPPGPGYVCNICGVCVSTFPLPLHARPHERRGPPQGWSLDCGLPAQENRAEQGRWRPSPGLCL